MVKIHCMLVVKSPELNKSILKAAPQLFLPSLLSAFIIEGDWVWSNTEHLLLTYESNGRFNCLLLLSCSSFSKKDLSLILELHHVHSSYFFPILDLIFMGREITIKANYLIDIGMDLRQGERTEKIDVI